MILISDLNVNIKKYFHDVVIQSYELEILPVNGFKIIIICYNNYNNVLCASMQSAGRQQLDFPSYIA